MEQQRIGTSSQPLDAGVNPAHIPGLTQPAPAEPEDGVEEAERTTAPETPAEAEAPAPEEPDTEDTESAADNEEPEEPEETADAADAEAADGPAFEAADRRARIVADAEGVRLSLDEERCEFRWDEIAAVETAAARFGKRFTVTVHTPERRWYPIEIEAKSKSDHKKWDDSLDAVLDAYFDEGKKPEPEKPEPEKAEEEPSA
ncbi:hypothetical protein ABZX40_06095 [Streptomyces sp. NPDC004610]|uniref:hypothetical protein n=1 Tax=unclassified Streptomyces TaxID=2593676 RepID=UPI0033BF3F34